MIVVDAGGQVWVAGGRGVSSFDGTTWTTWTDGDGAPPDLGEPIVAGPTGEVWVGTDDGVARFLDGSWREYTGSETGIPENKKTEELFGYAKHELIIAHDTRR